MENLKHYKVQIYGFDTTTIKNEVEKYYKNNLEAITNVYKEYAQDEFNIYILKEVKENVWIKVAKIY